MIQREHFKFDCPVYGSRDAYEPGSKSDSTYAFEEWQGLTWFVIRERVLIDGEDMQRTYRVPAHRIEKHYSIEPYAEATKAKPAKPPK